MKYAQLDRAGIAVALLDGKPHDWPDLRDAGVLRPCSADVAVGWRWNGAGFDQPTPSRSPRSLPPLEFRRRFTTAERNAITLAASRGLEAGDATLQVWLDDLNSAGDLNLDSTELHAALTLLVSMGLLSPVRRDELLA